MTRTKETELNKYFPYRSFLRVVSSYPVPMTNVQGVTSCPGKQYQAAKQRRRIFQRELWKISSVKISIAIIVAYFLHTGRYSHHQCNE